jgi:hypothetical protein
MKKTYKIGELLLCPHCQKYPDGQAYPVEDFAVDVIGRSASTDCGTCDTMIKVVKISETEFSVSY